VDPIDRSHILGRDPELGAIHRFVGSIADGPRALVLEGSAGIGKTTLWRAGVSAARSLGSLTLTSRAAEGEATLSYSALGDLFEGPIDDALAALPEPQRRALDAALLRSEPDATLDRRAISLGSLGVIRSLGTGSPVVLAIDDVQWLDTPSARVLTFVLRRLRHEPVGMLVSLRLGSAQASTRVDLEAALGFDRVERLRVGPLGQEATGRMLRERIGVELSRPLVHRIHEITQGSPLFALESARELVRIGDRPGPGDPLPVPDDLRQLLAARIASLPTSARDPLLVVSATLNPTVELVRATCDRPDQAVRGLAAAEEAGVIESAGGGLRFTHPLLASTVYATATADRRRSLHRRLSDVLSDPEERARHLALATTGPDAHVASVLDEAARYARVRGAPDAAAELVELAIDVTPAGDVDDLRRRRLDGAGYHFDAGDAARANELLDRAIDASPPGTGRAELLYRLSSMSWMNLERGVRSPLERALPEAAGDDELLGGVHLDLAWVDLYQADLDAALEHARASVDHAAHIDDPATKGDALATLGMVRFLRGEPDPAMMTLAVELQDAAMERSSWTEASVYTTPRAILGLQQMWSGALGAARATLEHELAEYERLGMYTVRQEVLCYLAELECRAGRYELAASYADEAAETVAESGMVASQTHVVRFNQALAAAHLGQVEEARALAAEGLDLAHENDDSFNAAWNGAVLGFLDLSLGKGAAAHAHLAPVVAYLDRLDAVEPGIIPCIPDEIEALIAIDALEEASALLDRFARRSEESGRPWALAASLRCRGALIGATGDVAEARAPLDAAMAEHDRAGQPFETARTLLVRGIVERRGKQKRTARHFLETSIDAFDSLGTPLWSAKARDELHRARGASSSATVLTPTEERVAQLVAQGKSNREVAGELFVSVKTVESNLTRIFHKLGIRSRAELIRREALGSTEASARGAPPADA
jgi:DNA-binding CsgD family transcriptional regulator/tetratricopeptide (TPR) repeat protein